VRRLNAVPKDQRRATAVPEGDGFDRHFSAAFDAIKGELAGASLDPAVRTARLAQIETAQHELEHELNRIETDSLATAADAGLPVLVMATFLRMDIRQDADLLAFARQTAADAGWSDVMRGQAFLAHRQVGRQGRHRRVMCHLDSGSAELQTRALQSLWALQTKATAASAKP